MIIINVHICFPLQNDKISSHNKIEIRKNRSHPVLGVEIETKFIYRKYIKRKKKEISSVIEKSIWLNCLFYCINYYITFEIVTFKINIFIIYNDLLLNDNVNVHILFDEFKN